MELNEKDIICKKCTYYYPLSWKEKHIIQKNFDKLNFDIRDLEGVCLGSEMHPEYLIQRFIFGCLYSCTHFAEGISRELLGITCPSCQEGELSIMRLTNEGALSIVIACSLYPECDHIEEYVTLDAKCKNCGSNLRISGGEILKCYCASCSRGIEVPITIKLLPRIYFPNGGCVHNSQVNDCEFCAKSREENKTLLFIEASFIKDMFIKDLKQSTAKKKQRYGFKHADNYYEWNKDDYNDPFN